MKCSELDARRGRTSAGGWGASPKRWLAAGALLAALAVPGFAQAAGVENELATAENAYAALDYANALTAAEAVLAQQNLSHDVLTRATRVSALSHAALGHADQAKQQFILLLEYDSEFKVDPKLGPRFTEPFAEARGYWQAQGRKSGMDLQVVVQWGQAGEIRIVTRDPLGIVKRVSAGHRWAPAQTYTTIEVAPSGKAISIPANPEGSTRLEYWVRALDAKNNAVFEQGTPETPQINLVTEPVRGEAPQEKKSVFSSPLFYIIGGSILAGAAVGGFFALRPTEYQPPPTGRGVFGATCGSARCD
ncbi:MAG: hypothetical protein BGO98_03390 [Myxococcales bacterium 68-20]|nr:hypothetical protein [Myxococcales bacterium]OJY21870.1 MAG: hypothetical protein BGO98_03390 [Myxococcales bacterium 68-20]